MVKQPLPILAKTDSCRIRRNEGKVWAT